MLASFEQVRAAAWEKRFGFNLDRGTTSPSQLQGGWFENAERHAEKARGLAFAQSLADPHCHHNGVYACMCCAQACKLYARMHWGHALPHMACCIYRAHARACKCMRTMHARVSKHVITGCKLCFWNGFAY